MPQVKEGVVVSNKMKKTVVVKVNMKVRHPLYKKIIVKSKKFKARDEIGVALGQKVKIVETQPFSKDVHFKILKGTDDGSN
ncbi:MAG TPA: 30S ribosomal protein S17 [Patescibacteria group bacterium]|nr:30S ribosomal protein S17 [Patescibacteria group bacterium]